LQKYNTNVARKRRGMGMRKRARWCRNSQVEEEFGTERTKKERKQKRRQGDAFLL